MAVTNDRNTGVVLAVLGSGIVGCAKNCAQRAETAGLRQMGVNFTQPSFVGRRSFTGYVLVVISRIWLLAGSARTEPVVYPSESCCWGCIASLLWSDVSGKYLMFDASWLMPSF